MKLLVEDTKILAMGSEINGNLEIADDAIPADFFSTFSLGKYRVVNSKIEEVPGFVMPKIPDPI